MEEIFVTFNNNNYTQKCRVPDVILRNHEIKVGDYVLINLRDTRIVCKIYAQVSPVNFIEVEDTVSTCKTRISFFSRARFPEHFQLFSSPESIAKIQIRIVMKDVKCCIRWSNRINKFKKWIRHILCQYAVMSGCVVKCSEHPMSKMCGIQQIDILNTYRNDVSIVTESTSLDITGLISGMQVKQIDSLKGVRIGGMEEPLRYLKSFTSFGAPQNYDYHNRILVTGPSGGGKTLLVKKLAHDMRAYLHVVHLTELIHMKSQQLRDVFDLLSQMSEMSSDHRFVVLFKGLDCLTGKEESKAHYLVAALLDSTLLCRNITVFGTAVSSRFVSRILRKPGRFVKEFHIGVPNTAQRESILKVLMSDYDCNVDFSEIAEKSPGYLGSDLSQLCAEAIRNLHDGNEDELSPERVLLTQDFETALSVVKPTLLKGSKFQIGVQPINWENIGGLERIKKKLKMYVEWPLLHPKAFSKVGIPCPRGVLLYGPPGCCKTTLVRVLATECRATFLFASPAQIYSPFVGDSEKSIIELFNQARLCAPTVIFFDEIESLVGKRSYSSSHRGIQEKVLSALLNEMDGIGTVSKSFPGSHRLLEGEDQKPEDDTQEKRSNENVIVVAATNRIDLIDDALLRPGRFDSLLFVPLPDIKEREDILKVMTSKMAPEDVDMKYLASQTELFSGADLKNLCRMAGLSAIKNSCRVTKEHFDAALKLIHPSITKKQLEQYECLASRYGPLIT